MLLEAALRLPQAELTELAAASWVVVARRWRPSTVDGFEARWREHPPATRAIRVFNRPCFENRFSRNFGARYTYSGQTTENEPLTEDIEALCGDVNATLGTTLNSCLENWYEHAHDIAPHADDEKSLNADEPVVSLSWGATRRFVFHPKTGGATTELLLHDGDLCVMGGDTQRTHKHSVPKMRIRTPSPSHPAGASPGPSAPSSAPIVSRTRVGRCAKSTSTTPIAHSRLGLGTDVSTTETRE